MEPQQHKKNKHKQNHEIDNNKLHLNQHDKTLELQGKPCLFIVGEQYKKQNNNTFNTNENITQTKPTSKQKGRIIHHENKNKNNRINNNAKNKNNVGFKEGMLGNLSEKTSKHEQRQRQQKKQKKQNTIFFKKGLMDKSQRKIWNFEREDKSKARKQNRIKKKDFKDRPLGDTKNNSEIAENNLLRLFPNKTTQRFLNNKAIKNKKQTNKRKHLFACRQKYKFGKFMFFFNLHFYFCKAVLR